MRPIAAFSMEDYEKLTRNAYQAAEFKRGKDKKKRKKRGALDTAGMVAGGLAGVGALGAAGRYGYAEATKGKAVDAMRGKVQAMGQGISNPYVSGDIKKETLGDIRKMNKERDAMRKLGGGAKSAFASDMERIKGAYSGLGQGLTNVKTQTQMMGKDARYYAGKGLGTARNAGMALVDIAAARPGLAAGAGLGAAALLGGAAYGASRMMNKKKKK